MKRRRSKTRENGGVFRSETLEIRNNEGVIRCKKLNLK